MPSDQEIQSQLTPTKQQLTIGGITLFTGGGCLMFTVILIPLAIPLSIIGLIMAIASRFVQTQPLTCPVCQTVAEVEPAVDVVVCPACRTAIRRAEGGWIRLE